MTDSTPIQTWGNVISDTDPKGKGGLAGQLWVNRVAGRVWVWDDKSQSWQKVIGN